MKTQTVVSAVTARAQLSPAAEACEHPPIRREPSLRQTAPYITQSLCVLALGAIGGQKHDILPGRVGKILFGSGPTFQNTGTMLCHAGAVPRNTLVHEVHTHL